MPINKYGAYTRPLWFNKEILTNPTETTDRHAQLPKRRIICGRKWRQMESFAKRVWEMAYSLRQVQPLVQKRYTAKGF